METRKTHKQILEEILRDRNLQKSTFAVSIGYTKTNYTSVLNKEYYSNKLLNRICTALDIDIKAFENSRVVPNISDAYILEENKLLKEQIEAQKKIIHLLEEKLNKQ